MPVKRIAILFSGEGSNLENLIRRLHLQEFASCKIEVVAAITNKPDAKGVEKAKLLGVNTICIPHEGFESREAFDRELVKTLRDLKIDLTVLAGFMRILTPIFTDAIRAINVHPSLLPLFKGANALQRSYESDMKVAGVTVHEVITEIDAGRIIAQSCFEKGGMDFETFKAKIHALEHEIFPKAVVEALTAS